MLKFTPLLAKLLRLVCCIGNFSFTFLVLSNVIIYPKFRNSVRCFTMAYNMLRARGCNIRTPLSEEYCRPKLHGSHEVGVLRLIIKFQIKSEFRPRSQIQGSMLDRAAL
jgi:hypothetical protein